MRPLRSAVLIAGALTAAALVVPARAAAPAAPAGPCVGPLACGTALDAALEREARAADHLWYGQMLEIDYNTAAQLPGDVRSGGAWGDSGLWTGVYLGGESLRYATAKGKLAGVSGPLTLEEQAFWVGQRDEALGRVRTMVAKFHLLARIGREWKTSFSPNPTGNPPSFGGGVLQGEDGLLMRACAPDPTGKTPAIGIRPNENKRVFGPFRWEDGVDYYCETAPSRDTYAGVTFGLGLAFDLVSGDDPAMREQIRSDILVLATRLVKYGWTFPRPHGNVSIPAPLPVPGGNGHFFDNFISPEFMEQVPLARLNIATIANHMASTTKGPEKKVWKAVYAEELASQLPVLGLSMEVDAIQPNEGYYKYNLHHLTGYTTLRLTPEPAVQKEIRRALAIMDKTTGDDLNAHFEAITYAMTGERARHDRAVTHLGQWLDYRRNIHAGPVTNSTRCGGDIECVLADQLDIDTGAAVVTVPGQPLTVDDPSSENPDRTLIKPRPLRARFPLPVAERPPSDFIWQRPPTNLNGGDAPTHSAPGIDYLTPYWMLRYYSEIAPPARAPLPAWVGPAHR